MIRGGLSQTVLATTLAAVVCGATPAQDPTRVSAPDDAKKTGNETATVFQAGDGSPFLLVPLKTRTVHWINLHPARMVDEPAAYPGLAVAVARASLLGPAKPGDPAALTKRTNPFAWEKALRRAPSNGSELVRVHDHLGVRVTFPIRSLGRVANLLRLRTRRKTLTGLEAHYAEARAARTARLEKTADLALLRRALDAASPRRKLGTMFVRGGVEHLDEDVGLAFYQWNCHPTRSINVLVGGFDPEFAKQVLQEVFRTPPIEFPAQPETPAPKIPRAKSKVVTDGDALMVVCPLPQKHEPGLDLLVEMLAGERDAFLPAQLRVAGHGNVVVRASVTTPPEARTLLLHVTEPGLTLGEKSLLGKHVAAALRKLTDGPPPAAQLAQARARITAREGRELADQEGLAEALARHWVRSEFVDPTDLHPSTPKRTPSQLQSLAAKILAVASRRTVASFEEKPR